MQIVSKTNSILAGIKQPAGDTCPQLSAVLKVFQLQEETRNKSIIGPRNSIISMDKINN